MVVLGPSGSLLGHLGSLLGHLGSLLGRLGSLLGRFGSLWGDLGLLWSHLGLLWEWEKTQGNRQGPSKCVRKMSYSIEIPAYFLFIMKFVNLVRRMRGSSDIHRNILPNPDPAKLNQARSGWLYSHCLKNK